MFFLDVFKIKNIEFKNFNVKGQFMICMLCGTANRVDIDKCKQCGSDLATESKSFLSGIKTPAPTILVTKFPETKKNELGRKTEYIVPGSNVDNISNSSEIREVVENRNARKTQLLSSKDPNEANAPTANNPKLVGFLVSYSWNTSGEAYKIYDGKNSFGSSSKVDWPIPFDRALSSEHFVVMARGDRIKIKDLTSTNATTVDGVEIWSESSDVVHGTKIKAGDTEFIMVLIP